MAKFRIPLFTTPDGWQYISFPFQMPVTALPHALAAPQCNLVPGVDWDIVQWFNPVDSDFKIWATFKPPPLNDLKDIDFKMGFIIHALRDVVAEFEGDWLPNGTIVPLRVGVSDLNIVGFPLPHKQNYTVGDLKADTGALDVLGGTHPYKNPVSLADGFILYRGMGIWVQMPANYDWTEWYEAYRNSPFAMLG